MIDVGWPSVLFVLPERRLHYSPPQTKPPQKAAGLRQTTAASALFSRLLGNTYNSILVLLCSQLVLAIILGDVAA